MTIGIYGWISQPYVTSLTMRRREKKNNTTVIVEVRKKKNNTKVILRLPPQGERMVFCSP
eukprot:scaffold76606_cov46-Prasinocladus_malaysianus.AAC.1